MTDAAPGLLRHRPGHVDTPTQADDHGDHRELQAHLLDRVGDSRDDLDGSVTTMRVLVILGGIVFAVGQLVPYWIGSGLLTSGAPGRR